MIIEERVVPDSVIDALVAAADRGAIGCMWLEDGKNIAEIFVTEDQIAEATGRVREEQGAYKPTARDASSSLNPKRDMWVDRASLLCFARSDSGNAFCFDYAAAGEPSVVWWNNVAWEKVAESPRAFLDLMVT